MERWFLRLDGCLRFYRRRQLIVPSLEIGIASAVPFSYNELMDDILYAVLPGTVDCYDGVTRTFTAVELAGLYGITDKPYITIAGEDDLPQDPLERMRYIVLKPRQDNYYEDYTYVAEDDGEDVAYRPDFDATKKYLQETNPDRIYPDELTEEKLEDDVI